MYSEYIPIAWWRFCFGVSRPDDEKTIRSKWLGVSTKYSDSTFATIRLSYGIHVFHRYMQTTVVFICAKLARKTPPTGASRVYHDVCNALVTDLFPPPPPLRSFLSIKRNRITSQSFVYAHLPTYDTIGLYAFLICVYLLFLFILIWTVGMTSSHEPHHAFSLI